MEQALTSLFSTAFLAFSIIIAILVLAIRRVVELLVSKVVLPKNVKSIVLVAWREWILRALPIITGGFLAHTISSYPYPTEFSSSSGRLFFGIVAGLLSSSIYAFVKSHVKNLSGEK
jgi:hypothetical protein